jgi:citrate lyase beta subunit
MPVRSSGDLEEDAVSEEEQTIRLKLRIIEQVVAEAQRDGDERWRRVEAEQAEPLRERLRALLQREGRYPSPSTIGVLPGVMGAKQIRG